MSSNNYGVQENALRAAEKLAKWDFSKNHQVLFTDGRHVPDLLDIQECSTTLLSGPDLKKLIEHSKDVAVFNFGNGYFGVALGVVDNLNMFAIADTWSEIAKAHREADLKEKLTQGEAVSA